MSNVRSTVQGKEVCLRKQLLTRIFLQTLTRDEDEDFYNEPSAHKTPSHSQEAVQLPDPPKTDGEQLTVPETEEQDTMEGKIQHEILQENSHKPCTEPIKKKLRLSYDNVNGLLAYIENNDNDLNVTSTNNKMDLQNSSNSAGTSQASAEAEAELKRTCYDPLTQKTKRSKKSEKRIKKKYFKILNLIEGLERRIAEFCNKENDTPMGVSAFSSAYDIPRLEYIKSISQKEKYQKYQSKTSKACKQLEAEISLYSQYVDTLETAITSIPKDSEICKVLQEKYKKAHNFHLQNPLHKEVKELDRQCVLIELLLKRFP